MTTDSNPQARDTLQIELCYAKKPWQIIKVKLQLPAGSTIKDAIDASKLAEQYPEVNTDSISTGIYSTLCPTDRKLQDGDRVELYRELPQSPMHRRQKNADER